MAKTIILAKRHLEEAQRSASARADPATLVRIGRYAIVVELQLHIRFAWSFAAQPTCTSRKRVSEEKARDPSVTVLWSARRFNPRILTHSSAFRLTRNVSASYVCVSYVWIWSWAIIRVSLRPLYHHLFNSRCQFSLLLIKSVEFLKVVWVRFICTLRLRYCLTFRWLRLTSVIQVEWLRRGIKKSNRTKKMYIKWFGCNKIDEIK